jgi:hypothetical protein
MVFGLFSRGEPRYIRDKLAEIKDLGVDSISITLPWVTPHVRSLEIAPRGDMTPDDEALRMAIRTAHDLGMRVFLMPLVYLDHMDEGDWRGVIDPPDWGEWFEVYGKMILHYGALAAEERVEYFSVGSELCSSEHREEDWLALIARVRALYPGALTYSSNWDHRDSMTFAGALDFAGTNAYFELSDNEEAGVEELKAAWAPVLQEIEAWRAIIGKPLILTEVGYPSRKGAIQDPWDYTRKAAPDPELQERAYQAFVEAWTGTSHLAGVYFYMWWGDGGLRDTGYTPRGKPAEQVVRKWYSDTRPDGKTQGDKGD